jgi:hypothetical protein
MNDSALKVTSESFRFHSRVLQVQPPCDSQGDRLVDFLSTQ